MPSPQGTPCQTWRCHHREIKARRQEIDVLAAELVKDGVALWENEGEATERLIVRGRGNLLGDSENEAIWPVSAPF